MYVVYIWSCLIPHGLILEGIYVVVVAIILWKRNLVIGVV